MAGPRTLCNAAAIAACLIFAPFAEAQVSAAQQVQQLAPQLVVFAGSQANFESLANGLAQGLAVTLVGTTADGLQQTATFTPAGRMTPLQVAQRLEQARQQLITQGIAAPTPEQIAAALVPRANVAVQQAALPASTGASAAPVQAPTMTSATPFTRNTSDTPFSGNTSNSPLRGNTSDSRLPGNASNSPGTVAAPPNGTASPAAQMQGRR